MTEDWDRRARIGCALLACACAGALGDGLLRMKFVRTEPGVRDVATVSTTRGQPPGGGRSSAPKAPSRRPDVKSQRVQQDTTAPVAGTTGSVSTSTLRVPIDGVDVESFKGGFAERRDGDRPHEAVDILAPRNTPIVAVEDGSIAKLFESKAGGLTVYQYDPSSRLAYYYAHLERYADGLHEGQEVRQGDVIGYVGTSGNAPPNTPHLHFAIFELDDTHRWWKGKALDPYIVFKNRG